MVTGEPQQVAGHLGRRRTQKAAEAAKPLIVAIPDSVQLSAGPPMTKERQSLRPSRLPSRNSPNRSSSEGWAFAFNVF